MKLPLTACGGVPRLAIQLVRTSKLKNAELLGLLLKKPEWL